MTTGIGVSAVVIVTWAVLSVGFVAVLLFVLLIILRFLGSRHEVSIESTKARLRPLVFELVTEGGPPEDIVSVLSSTVPKKDRKVLEQVLLETAQMVKGKEREDLASVFDKMGYADEDIRSLKKGGMIRRAESAFHLGIMRTDRATPYLIDALSPDKPEVEFACLNALSKIGTPDALEAVFDYLASSPGIETMRVAEVILEKKQEFAPYMERWLEKGVADTERLALGIAILGAMRDTRSVPVLLSYLEHSDDNVRANAAAALGNIGDFTACDTLAKSMNDPFSRVRAAAAEALGKLQCENALVGLEGGISDPSLAVRMNAAIALTQLGDDGLAALERGLSAAESDKNVIAAEVLDKERVLRNKDGDW